MTEENPKPNYLNEKVIIKDNRAYVLWAISLVIGFIRGLIATAIICIPLILFILLVSLIGFGFNASAVFKFMNGLLYQFLLFCMCFTVFLLPIILKRSIILKRQWYIFVAIIIFPSIFFILSQIHLVVSDDIFLTSIKLGLGTISNVLGVLLFLNLVAQSDKPFKDIEIRFWPKGKEPTEEEKAAIEKLKKLNIVGKIFH